MGTIARMAVELGMDASGFEAGIAKVQQQTESMISKLGNVGKTMSAAVTLPLVGAAGAALKFSTDLNAGMANTASLGIAAERVEELKSNVQSMAVETGKSTSDLSDGLYQVVSAFGDTADTAKILEINAKASAAGLAGTTDAINLTSAITKGYGDTSAEAVQHAADLALETVKLGQTTFPELAASMGRVVPLAASLGAEQEELFGVMATATGVTGNAAEVSTQLRGVLQSLMAPTEDMTGLINSMGYETGAAMLQQEGMQGTIQAIVAAAEASGTPLQKYIGSIEGQTLALALAGPQADVFGEKLLAMSDVAGSTDEAFAAQTKGINKAGFTMKQMAVRAEVIAQKIGDGLAPALSIVLDIVTPLIDEVMRLADWFTKADAVTQTWIVGAVGLVAAIGPVLAVLPTLAAGIGILLSPVGLVIAGVAALAAAWTMNFGGIQQKTQAVFNALQPVFKELQKWFDLAMKGDFSGLQGEIGNAINSVKVAVDNFEWSDFITSLTDWGVYITKLAWDTIVTTFGGWATYITSIDWGTYITTTLSDWGTFITRLDWGGFVTTWADWATKIATLQWNLFVAAISWAAYIDKLIWDNYLSKIDWGGIIPTLLDWGTYVSKLAWSDYIVPLWTDYIVPIVWENYLVKLDWNAIGLTVVDWATWIPALAWEAFIMPIRWGAWIVSLVWNTIINPVNWKNFLPTLLSWNDYLSKLQWNLILNPVAWGVYIGTLDWGSFLPLKFAWTKFIEKVNWLDHVPVLTWPTFDEFKWSDFVEVLGWPKIEVPKWSDFIPDLSWPTIKAPKWEDFIPDISWPTIPAFPGWVDILAALGFGQSIPSTPSSGQNPATQPGSGTSDGAYGQPGANVDINPPYPEADVPGTRSRRLGGIWDEIAAASGGQVVINANVASSIDVHALAYQVAAEISRWRR